MVDKAVLEVKMSLLKRHLSTHFLFFKPLQILFIIQKVMKNRFLGKYPGMRFHLACV